MLTAGAIFSTVGGHSKLFRSQSNAYLLVSDDWHRCFDNADPHQWILLAGIADLKKAKAWVENVLSARNGEGASSPNPLEQAQLDHQVSPPYLLWTSPPERIVLVPFI